MPRRVTPVARQAPPPPPPPPTKDDDDGMPSLDSLGELEATGKPDAFSNMPPPMLEAEPGSKSRPKRAGTTIADADPVRAAEIAKEKAKMNRRAMLAARGGILGTGTLGFAWFVLKVVGKTNASYNRNKRRREDEEADAEAEDIAAEDVAETPSRRR